MNQRRNDNGRNEHAGQSGTQRPRQDWSDADYRDHSRYRMDRNYAYGEREGGQSRESWRSQDAGRYSGGGYDEKEWGGSGQYDPRLTGGIHGGYDAGRSYPDNAYSGSPGGQERPYWRQRYDVPYDYAYGNDYGQPSQGYARNTGSYGGNDSGTPYRPDFLGDSGRDRYRGFEPSYRNESIYGYGYQGGPSNQGGIGAPGTGQFGQGGEYGYSSQYNSGGQYGSNYGGGRYGQGPFAQGGAFAGTLPTRESRGFQGVGPKGYTRSDERLKEEISERLSDDPLIDASDVSIECSNGKITLRGQVDERWMKYRIEDLVDRTSGVKDIDNRLTVSQHQDTRSGARNSEAMQGENGSPSNGHGQHATANAASGSGNDSKKR